MARHVIMGFATNIPEKGLRIFLKSLRQHCAPQEVDVVLFMNPQPAAIMDLCETYAATVVPVCSIWKEVRSALIPRLLYRLYMESVSALCRLPLGQNAFYGLSTIRRALIQNWIHPQAGRWLHYDDYLRVHPHYESVLLSDVRDVFFQGSPFAGPVTQLTVFEQGPNLLYGKRNLDTDWFRSTLGAAELARVVGKSACCSGTVLGPRDAVVKLLAALHEPILRHRYHPVDQAILNWVIYHDATLETKRAGSTNGLVLTIADAGFRNWEVGADGTVRVEGHRVPVIHMYDRDSEINALVEKALDDISTGQGKAIRQPVYGGAHEAIH